MQIEPPAHCLNTYTICQEEDVGVIDAEKDAYVPDLEEIAQEWNVTGEPPLPPKTKNFNGHTIIRMVNQTLYPFNILEVQNQSYQLLPQKIFWCTH